MEARMDEPSKVRNPIERLALIRPMGLMHEYFSIEDVNAALEAAILEGTAQGVIEEVHRRLNDAARLWALGNRKRYFRKIKDVHKSLDAVQKPLAQVVEILAKSPHDPGSNGLWFGVLEPHFRQAAKQIDNVESATHLRDSILEALIELQEILQNAREGAVGRPTKRGRPPQFPEEAFVIELVHIWRDVLRDTRKYHRSKPENPNRHEPVAAGAFIALASHCQKALEKYGFQQVSGESMTDWMDETDNRRRASKSDTD
jgi:hypothetical protein